MTEPGEGVEQQTGKIAADRAAFALLQNNAFEVTAKLGLDPGWHHFTLDDHPEYEKFTITTYSDRPSVELYRKPEVIGTSMRDKPYRLKRNESISRSLEVEGGLSYHARDEVSFQWRADGTDFDAELDTAEVEYDFTEPLPEVAKILADINAILTTVSWEQYDIDESDWGPDEPVNEQELKALEEALSTAGGAFDLMQLAALVRYGKNPESGDILVPQGSHSTYTIQAEFDPGPGDEDVVWRPDLITAYQKDGEFRAYSRKLEHRITHMFSGRVSGVHYAVEDSLVEKDGFFKEIDLARYEFADDEELPDKVKGLVKHILPILIGEKGNDYQQTDET